MYDQLVLRPFDNTRQLSDRRAFPGFPAQSNTRSLTIHPRSAVQLDLQAGDLLQIAHSPEAQDPLLVAVDSQGRSALAALGLPADASMPLRAASHGPFRHWFSARGVDAETVIDAARLVSQDGLFVLRTRSACSVWVLNEAPSDAVVMPGASAPVTVSHTQPGGHPTLPRPFGPVRDEFTVPRGTARSYTLRKGDRVQIIDIDGQQCSDFQALSARALERGVQALIDSTATRSLTHRAYPQPGMFDKFFDGEMVPMLRLVQDTCGRHDTFGLACTARGYEERGFPGHLNCSDNISGALARFDVPARAAWPAVNFFWSTWVDHHNRILTEESWSRPGDYVVMEALQDLVCVTTACPDDIDPINGWNPTDIHVRIYGPEAPIRRALAYRPKVDAPMEISTESAFHGRTGQLTAHFAPARNIWSPVSFPSLGTLGEYWACREAVTVQDMSGLRKYDIIGPDAVVLLQQAFSRDILKLAEWRGTYALLCDATGTVIDDGTLFRMGAHLFRWCCGSEESVRSLMALADTMGLQTRIIDQSEALPNLAIQGPKSRDLMRRLVFTEPHVPSLDELKWFGVTVARLRDRDGVPFMLSRTGYTGELGYEVFCARDSAVALWDAIMEAGADLGVQPMGSAALEIIRIEAGLAAAGAEFAPGVDAFEAGLGFAVDLRKADFVGRPALERRAGDIRQVLCGLQFSGDDSPAHGSPVLVGERPVGVITSATHSPSLGCAIAMARIAAEFAETGTEVAVGQLDGRMKRLPARVVSVPFIDPKRQRARS